MDFLTHQWNETKKVKWMSYSFLMTAYQMITADKGVIKVQLKSSHMSAVKAL